jgi:hypothetical protein
MGQQGVKGLPCMARKKKVTPSTNHPWSSSFHIPL